MKKSFALLFTILIASSLIPAVMARELPTGEETIEIIFEFFFGSGVPDEWLKWNGVMQFVLFPLIALFAVFYGIMEEIRIFRTAGGKNAQIVIGIVMAFVGGKLALGTMRGFLVANAWLGTVLFGILLFVGILAWGLTGIISGARGGWGDIRRSWREAGRIDNDLERVGRRINELRQMRRAGPLSTDDENELRRLSREHGRLLARRRRIDV
jgi:hypothetical protein